VSLYYSSLTFTLTHSLTNTQGGTTNYDVIVEGLTSLTNMVGFLNEYTSQRDPDTLK
jgi:hypothetical protein